MKPKIILCLVLVLSVVLAGCGTKNSAGSFDPAQGRGVLHSVAAQEPDILGLVAENPLNIQVDGKIAKFGDPFLARAVDKLADISRPWTVPKIIQAFENESGEWLRKLQQRRDDGNNQMWPNFDEEMERCGYLARVLAASRDPRAAVTLGNTLDMQDFPGGIQVTSALFDYFVRDTNYGLPSEKHPHIWAGNFYDRSIPAVHRWWAMNKSKLMADVENSPRP